MRDLYQKFFLLQSYKILIFTSIVMTSGSQKLSFPEKDPRNRHQQQRHERKQGSSPMDIHRLIHLYREQRKGGTESITKNTISRYSRSSIRCLVDINEVGHGGKLLHVSYMILSAECLFENLRKYPKSPNQRVHQQALARSNARSHEEPKQTRKDQ
jgi:hypothetical protein